MAKTQEELNALKEELKTLNKKLAELSEDELKEVSGGFTPIATMKPIVGLFDNGGFGWPAYLSCEHYFYYASTDPKVGGHVCEGGSIKGSLPACSGCPANQ